MIKKTITIMMLSVLPLIAQEDFLAGVKAEDLMLDRIEAVPVEIVSETEGELDYWITPSNDIAYSPDSSYIAEERHEKPGGRAIGVWIIDTEKKVEKRITDKITASLEWSPSGKYLAFVQFELIPDTSLQGKRLQPKFNSERLCIYNHQTGEIKSIAFMKGLAIEHSWSPFDNYLAYSYRDKGKYILAIFNAENNKNTIVDELIYCDLWNFSWSPNGRMLAYTKPLKMDRYINEEAPIESEVFIVNYDGTGKKQITNTPESEIYVKWLSDGSRIITEVVIDPEEYTWRYHYLVLKK